MLRTGSRLVALALGVALLLGVAACGGDSGSRGGSWFPAASGTSRDAEPDLDPRAFIAQISDAQGAHEAFSMSFTMSLMGEEMSGTAQTRLVSADPVEVEMTMTMQMPGLGTMEMRLVDGVIYMSLGAETEDKFVRIDLEDDELGREFALMLEQIDPTAQMTAIEEAVLDYRQEGDPEAIDGVETTPYVLVLDTDLVMEVSGVPAEELEGVPMPDTLEYTLFIGPDDLPRRMVMDLMGTTTTMDFFGYGEDVLIEAPPADQVLDGGLEELFSQAA